MYESLDLLPMWNAGTQSDNAANVKGGDDVQYCVYALTNIRGETRYIKSLRHQPLRK